jgi:hypothetical protein
LYENLKPSPVDQEVKGKKNHTLDSMQFLLPYVKTNKAAHQEPFHLLVSTDMIMHKSNRTSATTKKL